MQVLVPYTPVSKQDGFDLRLLTPHKVARTVYERRNEGFLTLGNYLSGDNSSGTRFIETQPVVMTYHPEGHKTMQIFLVPRDATVDLEGPQALPQPTPSAGIVLDVAGGELLAVACFEGNATQEACETTRRQLLEKLKRGELGVAVVL